jgi:photosystem II stability/assembly factor-like uncharacterized protein
MNVLRWALALASLMIAGTQACPDWVSIGPGGGGWLWSLAVAPDETGTVYVGCDVGGVYRSSDHGKTWQIVNQGLQNHYVQAIAFDPVACSIVYAGTRGGVYKSTDRGDQWVMKRNGFPEIETWGVSAPVAAVAVDPTDRTHVLAGIGEPRTGQMKEGQRAGLYCSRDGADSWQFVSEPEELAQARVYSILFDPSSPDLVLAATTGGVFRSEDNGETWAPSSQGLPTLRTLELAADGGQAGVCYVTFADEQSKTGGVALSDDGGRSWRVLTSASERDWQYWRIVADPRQPGVVYAALRSGSGIQKTTDGGQTWSRVTRYENVKSAWFGRGLVATALAIDPTAPHRLYYANDMEIYATEDSGATWDQVATDLVREPTPELPATWRGRGIETTCSSSVAVVPGCPWGLYLGYWDTGLWVSTDGGRTFTWSSQWMGYGKAAAIVVDPEQPWRAWMSFGRNTGPHRIFRTDDYGRDWRLVGYEDTGLPTAAIFSLVVDPSSPSEQRALLAAVDGNGIYRSDDAGDSWRRIDSGLGEGRRFTDLVIDPTKPRRLFIGAKFGRAGGELQRGGVFRSLDGGESWQPVGDIPERPRVVIAPSDPNVVYIAERDYSSVGRGGVYRSADGGDTWELMVERLDDGSGNVARTYIAALVVDPRDANHVYASSVDESYDLSFGKGVFESRDGGRTWRPMNEGLTHWNVHNLLIDPNDRLYAGTGGNGFFRWGPAPAIPGPAPATRAPARPPDPLCTTTEGWRCSAENLAEITTHDEAFWWGMGYVLARMDTERHGCMLTREFAEPMDISAARIVSLRLRARQADDLPVCIARMMMYDTEGRGLRYERDLQPDTTWTLVEVPLRDWEGDDFDRTGVERFEFEFWVPYAEGRPYEVAIGRLAFRP